MHSDFVGTGTATVDLRNGLCIVHAPGGVAILYRKSLLPSIEVIDFGHNWCTRVFHFLLFFSECLVSTGFPLFHLFNEVWCPLFPFETDIMIRSNSPKFSVFCAVRR